MKWEFEYTGEAYDACQCDARIKTGDLLDCGDTIGLAWTWPVSVTENYGHLHTVKDGFDPLDLDDYRGGRVFTVEQIRAAVKLARERGLALHSGFVKYGDS